MSNLNGNATQAKQDKLSKAERERRRQEREARIADLLPDQDDKLGRVYDDRIMRRLFVYLVPYKRQLIISLIMMSFTALLSVVQPWIIGQAIDEGVANDDFAAMRLFTILFLLAAIFEFVTNRIRFELMAFAGTKVVADVRSALFHHLQKLSLNFHNNYSIGRLMSRLISDVDVLQEFITWSLTGVTRAFFSLTGIIIAMLILDWQLALITFTVLPIMALMAEVYRKRVRVAYRSTRTRLSLINGYLNESITGIRITKSFSREKRNAAYFETLNESYFEANVNATRLTAIFFPGVDFVGSLAVALVVAVGGWMVLNGYTTAGVIVAFVLYVNRFFDPIRELARRFNTFQATMAASERIFNLLDTDPDLVDSADAVPLPDIAGRVVFDDVEFHYKEGEPVLQGIDLTAEPGQRIALVGETGAGKSTIIRLLARFFDVTGGAITIDGYDLRGITQASLRQQLGIVLQDTFLFSGSIMENIRYGRLDATDEAVMAAATAVGADVFIGRMSDGYQTDVGEDGVNLSVGQRQIVSFARALLADPRILILDEATSSVDTATEKQIERALDRLMVGRTSFVIAHRLSTIVGSDKIVVLDQGQIVEEGTHQELLAQRGRYFNLYTMQWAAQSAAQNNGQVTELINLN
ncbi:MAG: ABC transporter ATP-binding protein/permease [Anaerolineae bacterium]|nr:ABC transporter ATP-binding protein/permease [Anaerolineae bacterium]